MVTMYAAFINNVLPLNQSSVMYTEKMRLVSTIDNMSVKIALINNW